MMKKEQTINFSKEVIKSRIINRAIEFWGLKAAHQLDPLVRLMLEAVSSEVFHISHEIKDLENRMFDRISNILAPENLSKPLPSHLILQAFPNEPTEYLPIDTHFYCQWRTKAQSGQATAPADFFFSPLIPTKISRVYPAYFACGGTLFKQDLQLNKTFVGQLQRDEMHAMGHAVHIGIDTGEINDLRGLRFFLNWASYMPEELSDWLPLAKWYVNEQLIQMTQGIMVKGERYETETSFLENELLQTLLMDVDEYYKNNFFSLDDIAFSDVTNLKGKKPAFLPFMEELFNHAIDRDLLWLKVAFPAHVDIDLLKDLRVSLNAFPVVNKKLIKRRTHVKRTAVVPLAVEKAEEFLDVYAVEDALGVTYKEIPSIGPDESSEGVYSLKYSGLERYDTRQAKELIAYVCDLILEEKVAFASFGNDFLIEAFTNLEQILSKIAQSVDLKRRLDGGVFAYLYLNMKDKADILDVSYFVTNAELANGIPEGTAFVSYKHHLVQAASVFSLSQSIGGRGQLDRDSRTLAYKYSLTTGDRIVSERDIINFCNYDLGKKIKDVRLAKGVIPGSDGKLGWIKTVDVCIVPSDECDLSTEEWHRILQLTCAKLTARSVMDLHYRVLLAKENSRYLNYK